MYFKGTGELSRRQLASSLLLGGLSLPLATRAELVFTEVGGQANSKLKNPLLWAAAWSATSAEFGALCHQAYNLAKLRVDMALQLPEREKPLAIIADVDNTVVHAFSYWGYLINEGKDFFEDESWDRWIPENLMTLVPGALAFLEHCQANDVEVFYVTNRDQGDSTFAYAFRQLQYLKLPYADADHLRVFRDTSNKTPARESISESHELVLLLGDNLNDYKRDYYVSDIDERFKLMERDRDDYGDRFILLPNATDGHWVRAIFGESEPAASDVNRDILLKAATRSAWDGT